MFVGVYVLVVYDVCVRGRIQRSVQMWYHEESLPCGCTKYLHTYAATGGTTRTHHSLHHLPKQWLRWVLLPQTGPAPATAGGQADHTRHRHFIFLLLSWRGCLDPGCFRVSTYISALIPKYPTKCW